MTYCICGADKNKTPHSNDCPVALYARIAALERVIAELEEAAQKCVDETVGVIGCDALEELAKLLEGK